MLASGGFVHPGKSDAERVMLEVYPHAAYVAMFDLPSIIRYKKGSVAEKCAGLRIVQQKLRQLPFRQDAVLAEMLQRDPTGLKGSSRKTFEDSLDAPYSARTGLTIVGGMAHLPGTLRYPRRRLHCQSGPARLLTGEPSAPPGGSAAAAQM
jgi:hypothetical protein